MGTTGHLYFHAHCFDGAVSAVLARDYLEREYGWTSCNLIPVSYRVRGNWLRDPLSEPSAVVDFLFHPGAFFWADHHATTFGDGGPPGHLRRNHFFDPTARSCAGLLWKRLQLSDAAADRAELVRWAEKIDSADYSSPEEAVFGDAPALRISAALAADIPDDLSPYVVSALQSTPLEVVAASDVIDQRYQQQRSATERGLERFKKVALLRSDGIVVFDFQVGESESLSRYAPFWVHRNAYYSAGLVRHGTQAKISVMRNPWRKFKNVDIGRLCQRFGGGGHPRVGAIEIRPDATPLATEILAEVIASLATSLAHSPMADP